MHLLVNTGGGDAPGLTAVIRAITLSCVRRGFRVTGIRRGYAGLLGEEAGQSRRRGVGAIESDGLVTLTRDLVRGITDRGGTILGTVNKGSPFEYPRLQGGNVVTEDRSNEIVERYRELGADGLIAIGGDGSLR